MSRGGPTPSMLACEFGTAFDESPRAMKSNSRQALARYFWRSLSALG